jgi:predicted cytidylate kinase
MSLAEFNALAQSDAAVDNALDEQQLELLRRGGVILEGRLSGWLAARNGISAFKIWMVADEPERIRRLVERDGGDAEAQAELMRDRVQREADRYSRYYGADLSDLSIYDLVLDSTDVAPEALRDRVIEVLEQSGAAG